jgi:hypothetical protein
MRGLRLPHRNPLFGEFVFWRRQTDHIQLSCFDINYLSIFVHKRIVEQPLGVSNHISLNAKLDDNPSLPRRGYRPICLHALEACNGDAENRIQGREIR